MTIAIAVQVHDGVVLASDSATTLIETSKPPPDNVLNVYNNANKIFNLCKGFPIGGMTYGMGSIGSSSISTLSKDLRRRFAGDDPNFPTWAIGPSGFTVEDVATKVRAFLYEENFVALGLPPASGMQLGYIVAGYSTGAQLSEVWLIEIKDGNCDAPKLLLGQGVTNAYAGGDPEVFSRLVLGHGLGLSDALISGGVPTANVEAVVTALEGAMHIPLVEAPMPIQDAIEFGEFLVHTTAMFTRFKRGAATVGGPIESAAITKHEGFKWVRRKHYYDASLNSKVQP